MSRVLTLIGLSIVLGYLCVRLHGQTTRPPYPFTAYQIDNTCLVVSDTGAMVAVPIEAMDTCRLYTPEPAHVR